MGISESELIETFQATTEACDGFGDYQCINGWIRCAGYRMERDQTGRLVKAVVIRLMFPSDALEGMTEKARNARSHPVDMQNMVGARLGHH